jgi:hypothetical protein
VQKETDATEISSRGKVSKLPFLQPWPKVKLSLTAVAAAEKKERKIFHERHLIARTLTFAAAG